MIPRLVIAALVGAAAALFQVGAVPFFPAWAGFRPVMPLIALVLISSSKSRAFSLAVGAALVLDAYALDGFDLALLRLPATVFFLGFVADRFLTNRSVYATAALAILGRLTDWAGAWAVSFIAALFNLHDALWLPPSAPAFILLWDALFASAGFFLIASLTGRFVTRPSSAYAPR